MAQEHATREADISFPIKGTRMQLPGMVKQALLWYGQQARSDNNSKALAEGTKSVLHSETRKRPELSLNPIKLPEL